MPQLPVILTTFANSYDEAYLSHLEKEHDRLLDILAPLSYLRHIPLSSAKTGQLVSTLTQYQQELLILHFGGHADGSQLHFKDTGGQVAGLAENLSLHPQLKLVFLNGCNTQAQATQYLDAGVPAVIATTCSVADGQAMQFAEVFYTALAKGHTLEEAFVRAKGAMKLVDGGTYEDEILNWRGIRLRQEQVKEIPWRLYVAGVEALEWKLSNEKRSTYFLTLDHKRQDSPVIGRTTELQHLETLAQQAGTKPIVIYGASGVGKTLLAELYWEKHKLDYDLVAWLNYRTNLVHTILEELILKDAEYIDLNQAAEKKLEWTAQKYILHGLQNHAGRKLLVLNNVPKDSDVGQYLEWLKIPELQLLITANEPIGNTQAYALPPLNDGEIMELFQVLSGQEANAQTQELLVQLGQNALLPRLIACNVPHEDLRAAEQLIRVLRSALQEEAVEPSAEQGLLWALLQHSVRVPEQRWILLQFAAMPTTGFDEDTFRELVLPEGDELEDALGLQSYLEDFQLQTNGMDLERALEELVQSAWLEQKEDELWLPDAIRVVIQKQQRYHSRHFRELIESIRLSYFGEEYGPVKGNALFLSHLKSILPFLEYGETYVTLHRLLIKTYNDLVDWYEEEKELKLLLDAVEKHQGQWSEQFWDICHDLSGCCRRTGNIHEADRYSQVQLEVAQKIYANHPNLAVSQSERGLVLQDLGQYDHAAQLLQRALDSNLRNFGEQHPSVATSQSNLATVLSHLGQYDRAAQLLQRALDSNLRNFGEQHPSVAARQSNLATVLSHLGQYDRAAQLLQLALDSDLRNFGLEHPRVALNQSNLALVLKDLGDYPHAAQLLELALDSDLRNFGSEHPNVAVNRSNLSLILIDLGDYARAAQLLQLALDSDLRNFGPEHPNVALTQWNLASVYYQVNRLDKAKMLLEQALQTVEKSLGVNHPYYAMIVSWLEAVNKKLNAPS